MNEDEAREMAVDARRYFGLHRKDIYVEAELMVNGDWQVTIR